MPPSGSDAGPETIDLRGLTCPLPVLKTRRRLAAMAPGARLVVLTSDPLATLDIPAFCRETGHALVSSESIEGGHRFVIARGSADDAGPIPADAIDRAR